MQKNKGNRKYYLISITLLSSSLDELSITCMSRLVNINIERYLLCKDSGLTKSVADGQIWCFALGEIDHLYATDGHL